MEAGKRKRKRLRPAENLDFVAVRNLLSPLYSFT
jgi:hypothetical protein